MVDSLQKISFNYLKAQPLLIKIMPKGSYPGQKQTIQQINRCIENKSSKRLY